MKGITKKLNKANQYVIQKIGSAKGTELDEDFVKMERSCQIFGNMINEVTDRMENCLRISSSSSLSLLGGRKSSKYSSSQSDLSLSEACAKYANELSNCPNYSSALSSFADALKLQSSYKEQMDETVIQVFLEPVHQFHSNELKEINYLNKKMNSRKLEFDSNKRKCKNNGMSTSDELVEAQNKFETTRDSCSVAMASFLSNDLEKINQLKECGIAFAEYFSKSLDNFTHLLETIKQITQRAITDQQSMTSVNDYSEDYNDFTSQSNVPCFNYENNGPSSDATVHVPSDTYVPPTDFGTTSTNFGTASYVPPTDFGTTSTNFGTASYVPSNNFGTTSTNFGTASYVPSNNFGTTSNNFATASYVPSNNFGTTSTDFGTPSYDPSTDFGTPAYQSFVPSAGTCYRDDGGKGDSISYQTNVSYSNFEIGDKPWARALYNFEAERDDEVSFTIGNRIDLISRLDENWFYGSIGGKSGYFPIAYVEVVVPLDY